MATIELKGELTVNEAERLKKLFISSLQKKNDITLDFTGLEDIDVSIIQLIHGLFVSQDKNCKVEIKGTIDPVIRHRFYVCGLINSEDADDAAIAESICEKMRSAS